MNDASYTSYACQYCCLEINNHHVFVYLCMQGQLPRRMYKWALYPLELVVVLAQLHYTPIQSTSWEVDLMRTSCPILLTLCMAQMCLQHLGNNPSHQDTTITLFDIPLQLGRCIHAAAFSAAVGLFLCITSMPVA